MNEARSRPADYILPATNNPKIKACLELPCPCYRDGHVRQQSLPKTTYRSWSCSKCKQTLLYGFDEFVYCSCGQAKCQTLEFKCTSAEHGDSFLRFTASSLQPFLDKSKPELNILVMGETGVGKTTWINGLANYFHFKTLDEAVSKGASFPVPAFFILPDPVTYEDIKIEIGEDENEQHVAGEIATRKSKLHQLTLDGMSLNIIDTPGVCNSSETDETSFKNIKTYLGLCEFSRLHGICILLKPNSSRMNIVFETCFTELLEMLPRDALKNIVFCFTNTRTKEPGDSVPMLRTLLETLNISDEVSLARDTIYCTDNEGIRYLAVAETMRHTVFDQLTNYLEANKKSFESSWMKSVLESQRMVDYLLGLKPCRFEVDATITTPKY